MNISNPLRARFCHLAACMLGIAVTTVWFQSKDSDQPIEPTAKISTHPAREAVHHRTVYATAPWKTKSHPTETAQTVESTSQGLAEEEEKMKRRILAQFRHQVRMEAHTIASRLGLDSRQTEEFLTARLQDLESDLRPSDTESISSYSLAIHGKAWLDANLTTDQKQAYEVYQLDLLRGEAERNAITKTNEIASVIELTVDQRTALIQKFTENHVSFSFDAVEVFPDFISYGEPIAQAATTSDVPKTLVITESRIELPVFTKRSPWLSDILTKDQLATYADFQAKRRELQMLKDEEMRSLE